MEALRFGANGDDACGWHVPLGGIDLTTLPTPLANTRGENPRLPRADAEAAWCVMSLLGCHRCMWVIPSCGDTFGLAWSSFQPHLDLDD